MQKSRSMPDAQSEHPKRIAELKLVEPKPGPQIKGQKQMPEPPHATDDPEDMWDNMPV